MAVLLAFLVLVLDAMAVCPSLHELIHKDADSLDHQCAVTMFAHGQVDSTLIDVAMVVPPDYMVMAPLAKISAFSPAIEYLPAGRGPPAAFSKT